MSSIDAVFEQVKSHIAQHRADAAPPGRDAGREHFPPSLYERLDEAAVLADATSVQPFLTPLRLPVIGPIWQRLRLAAHNLVVFYVNRHAGAQIAFNREVTEGLREIVETLDEGNSPASALEVAALRAEIEALKQRLARLEHSLPRATDGAE